MWKLPDAIMEGGRETLSLLLMMVVVVVMSVCVCVCEAEPWVMLGK